MHFDDEELALIKEALRYFRAQCFPLRMPPEGESVSEICRRIVVYRQIDPLIERVKQESEDRLAEKNDG